MTTTMPSLSDIQTRFRGAVIDAGSEEYEEARALYSGNHDKKPALIVKASDTADVVAAVNLAKELGLTTAVRGGGHNAAGLGGVDDGLVIDLSEMNGLWVDPRNETIRVQGGATLADVDHAGSIHGLTVPAGIIASTGVGGLALGGGLGHLTRKYGLTVDSMIEAEVVLADGSVVIASETENPDLFWALRGGGGNFGVVTTFLFQGREVDAIFGGPTLWPIERSEEILRWYRDFLPKAPRDLNGFFAFLSVPPAPPFPEELWTQKMCGVVWCYTGDLDQVDEVFAPILALEPALPGVHDMTFPTLNSAFDPLYPAGYQWYWKADFVDELSDAAIAAHVEHGSRLPTLFSTMHMYPIDGAAHDVAPEATAFSHRGSQWAQVIVGVDPDPANLDLIRSWTRDYHDATHPYSADGSAYVNFMMEEGDERIEGTYGDNYARLREVKAKYDPENFFRVNQNIKPA